MQLLRMVGEVRPAQLPQVCEPKGGYLSLTPARTVASCRAAPCRAAVRAHLHNALDLVRRAGLALATPLVVGCGSAAAPPLYMPEASEPKARVVLKGETPFRIFSEKGSLSASQWGELLSEARVVCVGERHDNPSDHDVQWQVMRAFGELNSAGPTGLGMEMFDRTQQPALDGFIEGKLGVSEFLRESDYAKRWGFNFDFYRPLLREARERNWSVVALNAPRQWTKQVAKLGIDGIEPPLRAVLPEMDLGDKQHQAFFLEAMRGHSTYPEPSSAPSPSPPVGSVERTTDGQTTEGPEGAQPHPSEMDTIPKEFRAYYAAQVVWDETMAESAAMWLAQAGDEARMVIVAGAGHCHRTAIPNRLARRAGVRVLNLRPVQESDVDEAWAQAYERYDALLVYPDPPNAAGVAPRWSVTNGGGGGGSQ